MLHIDDLANITKSSAFTLFNAGDPSSVGFMTASSPGLSHVSDIPTVSAWLSNSDTYIKDCLNPLALYPTCVIVMCVLSGVLVPSIVVVGISSTLVVMTRAFVRSSSCVGPVPVLGGFVVSVRSSADVVATLRRVVRFSGDVVVVPHACVRSSSCVGPVPVLGGFVVSVPVRSSADVVATLRRVVRFSGDVVVVPHAYVRSSSCVGPVPVLGGFVVSVRSSADVVATLRVVWFSGDVVVVPPAYVRSSSFVRSVCLSCRLIVVAVCVGSFSVFTKGLVRSFREKSPSANARWPVVPAHDLIKLFR